MSMWVSLIIKKTFYSFIRAENWENLLWGGATPISDGIFLCNYWFRNRATCLFCDQTCSLLILIVSLRSTWSMQWKGKFYLTISGQSLTARFGSHQYIIKWNEICIFIMIHLSCQSSIIWFHIPGNFTILHISLVRIIWHSSGVLPITSYWRSLGGCQ